MVKFKVGYELLADGLLNHFGWTGEQGDGLDVAQLTRVSCGILEEGVDFCKFQLICESGGCDGGTDDVGHGGADW